MFIFKKKTILIFVALIVVFGISMVFYIGVTQNEVKRIEQERVAQEKEKQIQAMVEDQRKELESAQAEIAKLKDASLEVEKRQVRVETKIVAVQQKTKEASGSISEKPEKALVNSVSVNTNNTFLKEIMSRVVRVVCLGQSFSSSGTGFLWAASYSQDTGSYLWVIATNAHVLFTDNPDYPDCYVYAPVGSDYKTERNGRAVSLITAVKENYPEVDFALLFVNDGYNVSTVGRGLMPCEYNIEIGDPVHVIGYPAYGNMGDFEASITVTEGIISGTINTRFGEIYKTSARIDSGNSGGIAVNLEKECTYGQPTWVVEGNFSGLGLIQSNEMTEYKNLK